MVASPDWLEEILSLLRANGGRVTSQRRGILQALRDHEGHPTAEQLTVLVQERQPDVHESTLYRFLDELERLGVLDHAHLGHGPAVYHFADDPHHHLVCDSCHAVIQVPDATFEELRHRLLDEFGFQMDRRHFAVLGRCSACAEG